MRPGDRVGADEDEPARERPDGVRRVEVSHEGGTVEVVADDDDDDLSNAVRDAGYEVVA
ncbi:heavy metal transporter [Halobacteriales archaeon QS_9_68_17]|nr:MAG: heavy metal transporter [Halobacteriales archaeon QS_9_68_17]